MDEFKKDFPEFQKRLEEEGFNNLFEVINQPNKERNTALIEGWMWEFCLSKQKVRDTIQEIRGKYNGQDSLQPLDELKELLELE